MNCIVIVCDTLRRDHCGPYHQGKPLNQVFSSEQPNWVVPTPNMDRLAARGTVFDNAWCGSTPCMPARRDIYTGRYEFLEREPIDFPCPDYNFKHERHKFAITPNHIDWVFFWNVRKLFLRAVFKRGIVENRYNREPEVE